MAILCSCRRDLHPIPLTAVRFAPGTLTITMGIGQWDNTLAAMYDEGAILLELDEHEQPIRAYQRTERFSR